MPKPAKQDQSSGSINDRYNITKDKGRGLHLRELCRKLGISISYGFEHVWFNDTRFEYREARPYLEGLCEARKLSIYQC